MPLPLPAPPYPVRSTPVSDQQPAILTGGLLLFCDDDGKIGHIYRVLSGVTGGDVVGINDLTSIPGATLTGIEKKYKHVHLFGNLPAGVAAPGEQTDLEDFTGTLQQIIVLADAAGGVASVGLYGKGTINYSSRPYEAVFDATPIASRLEIKQFDMDDDYIESFDIEGIFLNNFYYRADLTGTGDPDDIIYYFAGAAFEENGEPYYGTLYKGITFDYNKTGYLGAFTGTVYHPKNASHAWAYNVFFGEVPHLVIKFANVKASADYIAYLGYDPFAARTYWYITVSELLVSGIPLTSLEQGYVYSIQSIEVSPDTLDPTPEPGDEITADVQVRLVPWIPVDASTSLPNLPW